MTNANSLVLPILWTIFIIIENFSIYYNFFAVNQQIMYNTMVFMVSLSKTNLKSVVEVIIVYSICDTVYDEIRVNVVI